MRLWRRHVGKEIETGCETEKKERLKKQSAREEGRWIRACGGLVCMEGVDDCDPF
jgi:hypothetical protein